MAPMRKVSNLINMVANARHEVLVVSDSDIIAEPDYLKNIAAELDRPGVGLVTCLYRGLAATGNSTQSGRGLAQRRSTITSLPSVLVGLKFGLATPCFGPTMALRRETLDSIGGFESIADQLADDYVLGALVRRTGLTVAIPAATVTHVCTRTLRTRISSSMNCAGRGRSAPSIRSAMPDLS